MNAKIKIKSDESVLVKITSYEAGQFHDSPINQRESSFLYMMDKYDKIKVVGYSPMLNKNVQSEAWLIQGVAVHSAVFSSGNAYWVTGQELRQEFNNALRPKQWFFDRIGKSVKRDPPGHKNATNHIYIEVEIKDELQAQYMFDLQQELYYESGICLNYRDIDKKQ